VRRKYDTFFTARLQQYLVILQEFENQKCKMLPHLHLADLNYNAKLQEENTTTCYLSGCVKMKKLRAD